MKFQQQINKNHLQRETFSADMCSMIFTEKRIIRKHIRFVRLGEIHIYKNTVVLVFIMK